VNDFSTIIGEADGNEVIPAGEYELLVERTEMKKTKAGDGSYINVRFVVASGQHRGASFFGIYNFTNPNKTAENIGRGEFKDLCAACGMRIEGEKGNRRVLDPVTGMPIQGPDAIKSKRFLGNVVVKRSEQYGDGNELKGCRPYTDMPAGYTTSQDDPPFDPNDHNGSTGGL